MGLPKTWTECHEGVTRKGEFQPCDLTPVVALRSDITTGRDPDDPRSWYPVCKRHVREPMVDLWRAFAWAAAEEPSAANNRGAWCEGHTCAHWFESECDGTCPAFVRTSIRIDSERSDRG